MPRLIFIFLVLLTTLPANAAIILQYHHVSDSTPPSTSVSPQQFARHLQLIADEGFQVVPLETLLDALHQQQDLPDKLLAITFDDGYQDIFDNAYPQLKKRGWPFSVFISPKPIKDHYPDTMGWHTLQEMTRHGGRIFNHSESHNHLIYTAPQETDAQWQMRTREDIQSAQTSIESYFPGTPKILAYPYGEYNNALKALLTSMGYTGIGQQSGPLHSSSDLLALPRYPASGVYSDLNSLREKLRTTGFHVLAELPQQTVISHEQERPELLLRVKKGDFLAKQIQCYASGQGAIPTQVKEHAGEIEIQTRAKQTLPVGRSRYNCTAPALNRKGYYYWFSHPWLRKSAQEGWPSA